MSETIIDETGETGETPENTEAPKEEQTQESSAPADAEQKEGTSEKPEAPVFFRVKGTVKFIKLLAEAPMIADVIGANKDFVVVRWPLLLVVTAYDRKTGNYSVDLMSYFNFLESASYQKMVENFPIPRGHITYMAIAEQAVENGYVRQVNEFAKESEFKKQQALQGNDGPNRIIRPGAEDIARANKSKIIRP